jgi:hypothetical protein
VSRGRLLLAVTGGLVGGYGVLLLVITVPSSSLLLVVVWMVVAVLVHDALWSPALLGVSAALGRVPSRARRHLQGGLVIAGCLTVVALPMIIAQGRQPTSTTVLTQDVGSNLLVLLGCVAISTVLAWALRVVRDRRSPHRPIDN